MTTGSLAACLARRCERGFVSFAQFMESALYDEQAGYYSKPHTIFGRQGDYVTAPHISPAFAQAVFKTLKDLSKILINETERQTLTLHWFEVAAGDGLLAKQLLSLWKESAIESIRLHYHAIEPHPTRAQSLQNFLQANIILDNTFDWKVEATLPNRFEGIVFANEFFDALPCEWLEWSSNGIYQLGVAWHPSKKLEEGFRVVRRSVSEYPRLANAAYHLPPSVRVNEQWQLRDDDIHQSVWPVGAQKYLNASENGASMVYRSEINLATDDWLHNMLTKMTRGFGLFFDYGFPAHEYYHPQRVQGTLKTHYQHQRIDDLFAHIGEQDITASVDFSAWAQSVKWAQAKVLGYLSLSHFMVNAGLDEFKQKNIKASSEPLRDRNDVANLRQLLDPNFLGEAVKVGLCAKNIQTNATAVGFQQYNNLARLF